MILNKKFLRDLDLSSYRANDYNNLATTKLELSRKFTHIVKTKEFTNASNVQWLITELSRVDDKDILMMCKIIKSNLDIKTSRDIFIIAQIINTIIYNVDITRDHVNEFVEIIHLLDNSLVTMPEDNIRVAANNMVRSTMSHILLAKDYFTKPYCEDNCTIKYITELDRKAMCCSECENLNEDGASTVKMTTDVGGGVDGNTTIFHAEIDRFLSYLKRLECNRFDEDEPMPVEFLVSQFKNIPEYVRHIFESGSRNIEYLSSPIYMLSHCHWLVRDSYVALEELQIVLNKIIDVLEHIPLSSYEAQEAAKNIKNYIEADLKERISMSMDDAIDIPVNPLIEMGLGYIYDILPEDEDTLTEETAIAVCEKLAEYANKHNIINVLQESVTALNEGLISDAYNDARKRKLDRYKDKRRKKLDKYRIKKRVAKDKYEMEKKIKEQEMQDDYERNKRLKDKDADHTLEDNEDKYLRKKEAKEARSIAAAEKLRTLPLTNNTIYKVYEALRRCIGAAITAGGAYLMGINPIVGACLYLIPKYLSSKASQNSPHGPAKERSRAIAEINSQLSRVETKLDEAERKNNYKAKAELSKLKTRLEHTRARIAADAGSKGSGIIL